MRILANILRTFKVSSRESCKITNRRYSSQLCPCMRGTSSSAGTSALNVVCVRSFTTTPIECKGNGAADTFNSSSGNNETNYQIIPVALLKTESEFDASPVKVLVIPINLFNNDKEAVQKTMSTMSVIRENADKIDAFTDNAAAFVTKNSNEQNSNVLEAPKRRVRESLWQNFNTEANSDGLFVRDCLEEILADHEVNRIKPRNSFDALDWNEGKDYIVANVPPSLERRFAEAGIASMDLAFEMDMTNIKDALMMRDKMYNEFEEYQDPVTMALKDPMISMTASVEADAVDVNTVPLNFNALIQGTVNIDSSKITPEDVKVPQFNDYVTSMAANICSTALQKGFPSDVSRMYSTKTTTEGPKKPRSPHIVCERQGDKGCISPGNAELDPYVPKGNKADNGILNIAENTEQSSRNCNENSLLASTIIGDTGARGLMSCKAYAIALKEAERLREVFAAAKQDRGNCKDGDPNDRKNPCDGNKKEEVPVNDCPQCPKLPCGPPKQDSICKDKVLRDPPEKEPGNDPCFPQDPPCRRAVSNSEIAMQACADSKPASKLANTEVEQKCFEAKLATEVKPPVEVEQKQCAEAKPVAECAKEKVEQKSCSDSKLTPEVEQKPQTKAEQKCAGTEGVASATSTGAVQQNAESKTTPVLASKGTDDETPCTSIPFKCPLPKKKEKKEQQEWDQNPCRQNYPKQCPPKTSVGGCKRPVVDPCAPQGDCSKPPEEKSTDKPCKSDPCGKKAAAKPEPAMMVKPQENFTFRACEAFKKACSKRKAPKDCEAPAEVCFSEIFTENKTDGAPNVLAKPKVLMASDLLPKEAKRPKSYAEKLAESAVNLTITPVTVDLCELPVSQFAKPDNGKSESLTLKGDGGCNGSINHITQYPTSKAPTKNSAASSSKVTLCPNTTAVQSKSTKPNCPKNNSGDSSARCFGTLFARRLFTAPFTAAIPVENKHVGNYFLGGPVSFYSKISDGDDDKPVDCPPRPPKPRTRLDIKVEKKGLRDCFAQERLDEPCTAPRTRGSCNKKPQPSSCVDNLDENKIWKRRPTLLLNPGNLCKFLLNGTQQLRTFTSSSVLTQNEKYKFEEHDENEDSSKLHQKVPRLQKPMENKGVENEIVRIGAAGEVLKVSEPIQNVTDYDILVRVGAIALSGSDIHVYETGGDKCTGITIGHDATGIVERVGKCVDKLKPGDCVAMESGLCCGICDVCKQGNYNLCPQLFHNGFFSTHQTHPADLCHKIPDNVTLEDATLTSILALGLQACFKAEITPTTNVLVIGTSPKACAAALCARALGAKSVAVMAPNVYTLESIRILFDFDYVHYYENETNLMEKVTERVCTVLKDRPNVVFNYAISESSMNMAIGLLKPGGKCVLAECDNEYASFNAMDILMKSISLITSFRSANMFPAALNLMKSGKTPIGELVSRIYTWDQIKWAFHWAQYEANMGNRKVIVQGPDLLQS